mgnify:CR=1 FL=1|jgi:hypothetical protein
MKQYSVYFSEEVPFTYMDEVWNKETKRWKTINVTKMEKSFTFYSLAAAKKLIKENIEKYTGSCITKIWANGDWENCGEIKLSGSNKTFIANSRQKTKGY